MSEFDVLVFGSAIVDFICYVPRLPKTGETLHGTKFSTGFGGKGANQCIAAAKLGAKTAFVAKLGEDSWGKDYLLNLKKENVFTDYVEFVKNKATGIAQISVANNGDNQIVIVTGANDDLSVQDVTRASDLFQKSKVLICQLETPLNATLEALKSFNGISILNAAPALEATPSEFLKLPSILCVNEIEASLMTGLEVKTIHDAKAAIGKLINLGANTIIITLGKDGAIYSEAKDRQIVVQVKVKKVENVVDTTGAGDAFIGSLGYLLAKYPEVDFHQKIGAACEIAAISVQFLGTQSSFPRDVHIDFNSKKFEWEEI